MATVEYVLAVGLYPDAEPALMDLRDLTNPGPTAEVVAGSGVVWRGMRGASLQQGGGGTTAFGIGTGAALGLIVDYWVPIPFVGAIVGALVGGLVGHRLKNREARHLSGMLEADLYPGSCALVCVVAEARLDEVRASMTRARKTTGRLLADDAARKVARGLVRGDPVATEALGGHS